MKIINLYSSTCCRA